jgi:hypothetical protein
MAVPVAKMHNKNYRSFVRYMEHQVRKDDFVNRIIKAVGLNIIRPNCRVSEIRFDKNKEDGY